MSTKCQTERCSFRKIFAVLLLFGVAYFSYLVFFEPPGHFVYLHGDTHAPCMIPEINPFDKDILAYFWKPDPIVCTKDTELVYIDDSGMMHINYSRTNAKIVNCTSQSVLRTPGTDGVVYFGEPTWFSDKIKLSSDFVKISCFDKTDLIHEQLYSHIHKSSDNFTEDDGRYSVLIIGIDGMSRLAAIRELPKTLEYLQTELHGHILKGYTKVGENTFPNMVAFLAGKIGYTSEFPVNPNVTFDNHPFIWNNFSSSGAATMYSEDWARLSTFNYAVPGFNRTPTTHYFRPFYLAINQMKKYQSSINEAMLFLEDKNIKVGKTSTLCYGDKPKHVIQLDYFRRFLDTYKNKLKFALSWFNEIGHDYVNFIKLADDDLVEFLKFLKNNEYLEKSILIFVSDHGSRVDKIRNTPIGRIEERLPFFSMVLPKKLTTKFPHLEQNVKSNINRLTSPFDFYETLVDIYLNRFEAVPLKSPFPRGISLFQEVPKTRTCADASIHEHNCACYTSDDVQTNSSIVQKMSKFLLYKINRDLEVFKGKCAVLVLNKIYEAKIIHSQLKHNKQSDKKTFMNYFRKPKEDEKSRYLVDLDVTPSLARFEATIEHTAGKDQFLLLGHVSRTNRYGNQSVCINDKRMKLYCYCI